MRSTGGGIGRSAMSGSYERLPENRGSGSPLRQRSPSARVLEPAYLQPGEPMPRPAYVQEPHRMAQVAGNIGSYDRIEQSEFAKVLKDNIFLERELESQRVELSLKTDFNLLDAFKLFDTRGSGNVSVQDIIAGLRERLGFADFTHDDVYLLFRRHDVNNDGKLNFSEFSNMLLPMSKEYAALLTDRPDFYMSRNVPVTQFFNVDTRNEFRNAWAANFRCERACEQLR